MSWPAGVRAIRLDIERNAHRKERRHLGGPFVRCRYELAGHDKLLMVLSAIESRP